MTHKAIPIDELVCDDRLQSRDARPNEDVIAEYGEHYAAEDLGQ